MSMRPRELGQAYRREVANGGICRQDTCDNEEILASCSKYS